MIENEKYNFIVIISLGDCATIITLFHFKELGSGGLRALGFAIFPFHEGGEMEEHCFVERCVFMEKIEQTVSHVDAGAGKEVPVLVFSAVVEHCEGAGMIWAI